jgi:hypothetical protein
MKRLPLTPGDVVGVTVNGRRRLFEIEELTDTQSRQVKARSIDPEVFAMPLPAPRRAHVALPPAYGPAYALALDLPSLDATQTPVVTRLAVFANPWLGTITVWRASDDASYQPLATVAARATIGETLDPLPAAKAGCWDRGHTWRVRLYGGALNSASETRVLNGANAAAVRNPDGEWEIVQFGNAELVDGNTYRLSKLLRGQAGSEHAIAAPLPAGAPFVVLDASLVPVARGLDALGRAMDLRIVAAGRSHDDSSAVSLTVTPGATALRPLSPVHVRAVREAGGVRVSWIRRTRTDGDGWNGEVPLGEDSESYRLDILAGGSVVRSITCAVPSALYAATDELADFGAAQASLQVRVAQLSSTVGAGFPTDIVLNV